MRKLRPGEVPANGTPDTPQTPRKAPRSRQASASAPREDRQPPDGGDQAAEPDAGSDRTTTGEPTVGSDHE